MNPGHKIIIQPFWRSGMIIQHDVELPVEGFSRPNSMVRISLTCQKNQAINNNSNTPLELCHTQLVTTDQRGYFRGLLPALKVNPLLIYHLIIELESLERPHLSLNALLKEPSDYSLVFKNLVVGNVYLLFLTDSLEKAGRKDLDVLHNAMNQAIGLGSLIHHNPIYRYMHIGAERQNYNFLDIYLANEDELTKLTAQTALNLKNHINIPLGFVEICLPAEMHKLTDFSFQSQLYKKYLINIATMPIKGIYFGNFQDYLSDYRQLPHDLESAIKFWQRCFYAPQLELILAHQKPTPKALAMEAKSGLSLCNLNWLLDSLARQIKPEVAKTAIFPVYDLPLAYKNYENELAAEPLTSEAETLRLAQILINLHQNLSLAPCFKKMHTFPDKLIVTLGNSGNQKSYQASGERLNPHTSFIKGFYIGKPGLPLRPAIAYQSGDFEITVFHPDLKNPGICAYAFTSLTGKTDVYDQNSLPLLPFSSAPLTTAIFSQDWLQLFDLNLWGLRSLNLNTVGALPQYLPIFAHKSSSNLRLLQTNDRLAKYRYTDYIEPILALETPPLNCLEIRYSLINKNQYAQHEVNDVNYSFLNILNLAGPYAQPFFPKLEQYNYLTFFAKNLDGWPKKLRIGNSIIDLVVGTHWQTIGVKLPARDDLYNNFISVSDVIEHSKTELPRVKHGSLLIAAIDLWYNSVLAQRYLQSINEKLRGKQ